MWVYTRARHEHDPRFLINLDHYPSIAINQLGERFFVDAGTGGDTATLASTGDAEEANGFVRQVFAALEAGKIALDLGADRANAEPPKGETQQAEPPKTPPVKAIMK
ncbi:MAG: hypothetical protein JWL77_3100 [Chthonomonadaceae bacterium]|nr:hypothetical protein [Chthonomonadaceae bacterium]